MRATIVTMALLGLIAGIAAAAGAAENAGDRVVAALKVTPETPQAQAYQGTPYVWLGRATLHLTAPLAPAPGHVLELDWGAKEDERRALAVINGARVTVKAGGWDGFRPVRVPLPDAVGGEAYDITLHQAAGGKPAFLAGARIVATGEAAQVAKSATSAALRLKVNGPQRPTALPEMRGLWETSPPSGPPGSETAREAALRKAAIAAEVAGYSLSKVQRWLHEVALKKIEPDTGLYHPDGNFNYQDAWADCYPFLCWAAWATDLEALNGPVRKALHAEIAHCPDGFFTKPENAFGGSEYVKDGLVAIVEVTGKDEWFERMKTIEEAIWQNPTVETPFGRIPSKNIEVGGEQLQVLARLHMMTGDERFLGWAQRLADYYLSDDAFIPKRLRDHGCEIIGGLGLLLGVESEVQPERARRRLPRLRKMFDEILSRGCNEDGIMYNTLGAEGGRLSDGWGYNYVGFLCYDRVAGEAVYRKHVARTLQNLAKPTYQDYPWEGRSIDGFADSIEGAIYCLNRVPVAEGFGWVDREVVRNVAYAAAPLETADLWGTMKLQSNGVRTVILHALMHTRGLLARPWRRDLRLGAWRHGEGLAVVIKSEKAWSGRLVFDIPRHKAYMGFRHDWPRMNTLPEWFTVEADAPYTVRNLTAGTEATHTGRAMAEGIPLRVEPGQEVRLVVEAKAGR
ncbi:MAG: hypothetical protein R6X20_13455 [Phycisphaerae bacterium]